MQYIIKRGEKIIAIEGDEVEAISKSGQIFSFYGGEKHGQLCAQEWTDEQGRVWRYIGSFSAPIIGDITSK